MGDTMLTRTNRAKWLIRIIVGILAFSVGMGADRIIQAVFAPFCPSEDSCAADYNGDHNTWIITEVTP